MSKIEPASIQRIKELVENYHNEYTLMSVILAWIHAEARARLCEYLRTRNIKLVEGVNPPEPSLLLEDWIAAVKKEVGWPGD